MNSDKFFLINGTANGGFCPDDIVNASALVEAIASSEKPLELHLRERFARVGLSPVPAWAAAEPEQSKAKVVEELNRIIGGDPLYSDARFSGVKLSAYARKLLRENPVGAGLVRLNKILLLDALSKHFRRKPGRGKNMIQQPAKVRPLGNGKFGVFVDLVEPREFEGKMRSGRQKFERQTQDLANSLCVDINAKLFGKELARQLTKREEDIAKKLFWEILETKHPLWIDHLEDLVEHAEETGFCVDEERKLPNVLEAAKLFWVEHVRRLEPESRMNFRNALGFLLPRFGAGPPRQMTDAKIRRLAYGKDPLEFYKTSWTKRKETTEEAEKRFWDTPMKSRSERPWKYHMKLRFISCVRVFKGWMHSSEDPETQEKRNWCPAPDLDDPKPLTEVEDRAARDSESDQVMDFMCVKHPALTIPQSQALLDVSHIAFDCRFAAFYAHGLFCGSRVKETKKMGVQGFDPVDGSQAIATQADKKDQGRESTLYHNLIVIVEALKSVGLYTITNLRPNYSHRSVIHILAGFTSNSKQAHIRANRERKRLAKLGIVLPQYSWGIPFPKNALRRTSLSMHYKLFGSEDLTKEWAGNGDVFRPFYKRLVKKPDACEYWVMLPSHLKEAGVKAKLPAGHKLDSAMTPQLAGLVSTAQQAAQAAAAKLTEAKAKAAANQPAELKARQAVYNKRAYLKRKANKLAQQGEQSQSGAGPAPDANPS
jgi:hypothetical protein